MSNSYKKFTHLSEIERKPYLTENEPNAWINFMFLPNLKNKLNKLVVGVLTIKLQNGNLRHFIGYYQELPSDKWFMQYAPEGFIDNFSCYNSTNFYETEAEKIEEETKEKFYLNFNNTWVNKVYLNEEQLKLLSSDEEIAKKENLSTEIIDWIFNISTHRDKQKCVYTFPHSDRLLI